MKTTHKILPNELCRGKQRQHRFRAMQSQPSFRCLVLRTELRMLHLLGKCSPVSDATRWSIFNSPERKYPHYTAQRFIVEILKSFTVCVLYEQIIQKPHTRHHASDQIPSWRSQVTEQIISWLLTLKLLRLRLKAWCKIQPIPLVSLPRPLSLSKPTVCISCLGC